ncbi:MAG: cob(I)yrinic acid a,c-diamide adenosyltransferase [bacterium]|nr:cob(I)yrinic acid a,c-diamide adenosyltransferase [bacterium]
MIHLYYGDGKGKTTAALGLAMRCAGSGKKVLMFQFLKGKSSSECITADKIMDVINGRSNEKFVFNMTDEEKTEAAVFYTDKLREAEGKADKYDMIILDEAADAAEVGFISEAELINFIKRYGGKKEIVITGHNPSKSLINNSDYVTEMRKIKHPFDNGAAARKGIEY